MLRRKHSADHKEDANWGPLSLVIVAGMLNRWTHPWNNPAAQSAAVTAVSGTASGQRVILSRIVRR
jgi:hypothetical protein